MYKLLLLIVSFYCFSINAEQLNIAVASNFNATLKQLLPTFKQQYPEITVRVSSASTGVLYAQIIKGAPFDVFLAADSERPRKLESAGKIVSNSRNTYALGKLVVWTPAIAADKPTNLLKRLQNSRKLAIANPRFAPYGIAAKQFLQNRNIWHEVRRSLVKGSNVSQVFQFVDSGNAEVGLLPESLLKAAQLNSDDDKYLAYSALDETEYQAIEQQLVVLNRAAKKTTAIVFVEFLLADATQKRLIALGFNSSSYQGY